MYKHPSVRWLIPLLDWAVVLLDTRGAWTVSESPGVLLASSPATPDRGRDRSGASSVYVRVRRRTGTRESLGDPAEDRDSVGVGVPPRQYQGLLFVMDKD